MAGESPDRTRVHATARAKVLPASSPRTRRSRFEGGCHRCERCGAFVRARVRTGNVPARLRLAPGRPRTPDRRCQESRSIRARDEGARFTARQGREPRLSTLRARAHRSLPRALAWHAARSPDACLRAPECAPARSESRADALSRVLGSIPPRPGWFTGRRRPVGEAGPAPASAMPVAVGRSWLLAVGRRRSGLLDPDAIPGRSHVALFGSPSHSL
jgi:hypothetical protein